MWSMYHFKERLGIVHELPLIPGCRIPSPPGGHPSVFPPIPTSSAESAGGPREPTLPGPSLTKSGNSSPAKKRMQCGLEHAHSGGNSVGRTKWLLSGADG